jgi:hypothetical protein
MLFLTLASSTPRRDHCVLPSTRVTNVGDAEWERLAAQLRRLLRVEAKAFQETSADDPVVTWLVVRLGAIAGIRMTNTPQKNARVAFVTCWRLWRCCMRKGRVQVDPKRPERPSGHAC